MLTLAISIGVSIAVVIACITTDLSTGGTVASGIGGFLIPQLLIGFLVRKKVVAIKNGLEEIVMTGQKRLNRKVQQFQTKPGGNIKVIQRQIENDQKVIFNQALDYIENFKPYQKWNLLMGKQISTMRLQFLYQLKEFEQVDELLAEKSPLKSPMMMEPLLVAMKMARQFKKKNIEAAEKTFKKRVKWFRGDRGSLLYGLMSWIYVKEGESEKARQLLLKGKESTANEVLANNWELLSNCKDKQFSNAGLGEEWYGLYLENPPAPKQQRMRGNAQSGRRF